jgi:hypothetical protein
MNGTRLKDLDELVHGIFVTALEGGIGYWSRCEGYRWSLDGQGEIEDLYGFEARVRELDGDSEDGYSKVELVINRQVILNGLQMLADGSCTFGGRELSPEWRARAAGWLAAPTSADLDAEDADVVVQAGLFGDVTYG